MVKQLLNDATLEKSEVVANAAMNRSRKLTGGDSYEKELGFNPVEFLEMRLGDQRKVAWLDLCCGAGRALLLAAHVLQSREPMPQVCLVGVDLIPMFDPV